MQSINELNKKLKIMIKTIPLRTNLTMRRFRDLMFKFLRYTKFDSKYISIFIRLNITKNVNKEFINENLLFKD